MRLFRSKGKDKVSDLPPAWAPAVERDHDLGLYADATDDEYKAAEQFCNANPPRQPQLLPSYTVERIRNEGSKAWGIRKPTVRSFKGFVGSLNRYGVVKVETDGDCGSVCLMSNLPIIGGLYDLNGRKGVYYEVKIINMEGIIAVGTACEPYPEWRFPGWNRLSAGLHLDDSRKFWENPNGGQDYSHELKISPGDVVGCGYEHDSTQLFFTYNGQRHPYAFAGIYQPRNEHDVFLAIGVEGKTEFEVNFGGDDFLWKRGNDWKVGEQVGNFGVSSSADDELPGYSLRA